MRITFDNTGKRFNREWIFRRFSYEFTAGNYAIIGPNGSGKSTLLQVIAGAMLHNEGKIIYTNADSTITEEPYKQIAFSAPYLELIEEMTALEFLSFQHKFKHLLKPLPAILTEVGLGEAAHKQIRYFSSGMKQRLKLAQAFFSDAPVLLLDEPVTNLDSEGILLYRNLLNKYSKGKTVIVSSNDPQEYDFCDKHIMITDYK